MTSEDIDLPTERSKHARHMRDAKKVADWLHECGHIYQADVIRRMIRSSIQSRATNKLLAKNLREALGNGFLLRELRKRKLHPEVLFFQDLLKKNLHKVK